MKTKVNGVLLLSMLLLSAFLWLGYASDGQSAGKEIKKANAGPSDEDIVKAIDDSGIMKRPDGSFTVVPPVKVVQRGKRNKDGSWPVKVKFTLIYKMKDGKKSQPTETTTSFRIFEVKDNTGKSVWKAQLGS